MRVGTFTVKSQETAHHQFNCVCSALSVILTGKRDYGGELENWLIRLRRSGADRHLYDSPAEFPLVQISKTRIKLRVRTSDCWPVLWASISIYIARSGIKANSCGNVTLGTTKVTRPKPYFYTTHARTTVLMSKSY